MEGKSKTGLVAFNSMVQNVKTQNYLHSVLGDKKQVFVANMVALVSNNRSLCECEPTTVMFACLKSAALDLSVDPALGLTYVIPYRDRKNNCVVAQWQMGARGYVQLALRSGQFKKLNVRDVRKGEIVGQDFVSGEMEFKAIETDRENQPIIGYVAYFKLVNGFEKQLYMNLEELEKHGKRFSQTYRRGEGLWASEDSKGAMMEKTVLKRLLSKYAPLSVDMRMAIEADQAILSENNGIRYVDNEISEHDEQQIEIVKGKFEDFEEEFEKEGKK